MFYTILFYKHAHYVTYFYLKTFFNLSEEFIIDLETQIAFSDIMMFYHVLIM